MFGKGRDPYYRKQRKMSELSEWNSTEEQLSILAKNPITAELYAVKKAATLFATGTYEIMTVIGPQGFGVADLVYQAVLANRPRIKVPTSTGTGYRPETVVRVTPKSDTELTESVVKVHRGVVIVHQAERVFRDKKCSPSCSRCLARTPVAPSSTRASQCSPAAACCS
jgi:hypothetical protein